jgi:transposase
MSHAKHTYDQIEEARFLHADGLTPSQIAPRVGAHRTTVKLWLDDRERARKLAYNRRHKRRKRQAHRKQEVIGQMVALRRRGVSYRGIASAIDVYQGIDIGPDTVRNWLREADPTLPLKPRGVPFGSRRR